MTEMLTSCWNKTTDAIVLFRPSLLNIREKAFTKRELCIITPFLELLFGLRIKLLSFKMSSVKFYYSNFIIQIILQPDSYKVKSQKCNHILY